MFTDEEIKEDADLRCVQLKMGKKITVTQSKRTV